MPRVAKGSDVASWLDVNCPLSKTVIAITDDGAATISCMSAHSDDACYMHPKLYTKARVDTYLNFFIASENRIWTL